VKIAVISDLHLGPGGVTDSFGHDDGEFLKFLRFLEHNFERIVLLGDIWETLAGRRYGNPVAELAAVRHAHAEIARRFARAPYTYIHGNHDLVTGSLEAAPEELAIEADGTRVLFTHGHHYDVIIRKALWLSELGVWVGGWIRRLGWSPLYRILTRLDGVRGGQHVDGESSGFQRWAVGVAGMRSADVVVTGHTHHAARTEHGRRLFLNSGSCSEGKTSFVSLDTRSGRYGVHSSW